MRITRFKTFSNCLLKLRPSRRILIRCNVVDGAWRSHTGSRVQAGDNLVPRLFVFNDWWYGVRRIAVVLVDLGLGVGKDDHLVLRRMNACITLVLC